MRIRVVVAIAATLLISLQLAESAAAGEAVRLVRPAPSWYTPQLHTQVLRAGANGIKVRREQLNTECPGVQGVPVGGVSAGGCIVSPFGCTANFIFTGGSTKYIGTARHCVRDLGDPVVMQVDTLTIAAVGTVAKKTSGSCPEGETREAPGCRIGHDFALIKLYKGVVKKWGVNPALPVGGPTGVYTRCNPQPVKYWGHGYVAAVAQGKPGGGLGADWNKNAYGWAGTGFGGDSGAGVVLADNRAAGNLTHGLLGSPVGLIFGMRATAILRLVGSGIRLMNAGGSTSSSGHAGCGEILGGGGLNQGVGTVGDAGQTVADAGQAVDDAGEAAEEAGDAVDEAGDKVEEAVEKVEKTVRGVL